MIALMWSTFRSMRTQWSSSFASWERVAIISELPRTAVNGSEELVAEIGEVAAPNAGCFLRGILSDTRLGGLSTVRNNQASADAGCYGQVGGDQDRRADKAERQKAPQTARSIRRSARQSRLSSPSGRSASKLVETLDTFQCLSGCLQFRSAPAKPLARVSGIPFCPTYRAASLRTRNDGARAVDEDR